MARRPQRIRDPLHDIIEFGTDQFEHTLWQVIQTRPFQRLRRVRQLGFSEIVYPGATHTRFAHSLGVFYTARRLMVLIRRHIGAEGLHWGEQQEKTALAAALVHDLGHGMFSHAFEDIGKRLKLQMARHEEVSQALIRDGEVSESLCAEMGSGFANDVADLIRAKGPRNLYDAVVSSQFDADRLDYMRRDRLMTGVENGGIDFEWLMANIEVGRVAQGADTQSAGMLDTFILGPKAVLAAETYVLALFQLYPTIYFHKTTRAAEKVFTQMMLSLIPVLADGDHARVGLPENHPLARFARNPDSLDAALDLDDMAFWGALPMLREGKDRGIVEAATKFTSRRLPKCVDYSDRLAALDRRFEAGKMREEPGGGGSEQPGPADLIAESIVERVDEWNNRDGSPFPRLLIDRAERDPYKRFQESKGPLNQIRIRQGQETCDIAEHSAVIRSVRAFKLFRGYYAEGDNNAQETLESIVADSFREHGYEQS